jgi:hypothetical protein
LRKYGKAFRGECSVKQDVEVGMAPFECPSLGQTTSDSVKSFIDF